MRLFLFSGLLAAALVVVAPPARAADVDVAAFTRDSAIGQLKLSPDGRFYAATVPGEGRSILAIVRREDHHAIGMFSLGENTYVHDFDWVNPTRVVISLSLIHISSPRDLSTSRMPSSA